MGFVTFEILPFMVFVLLLARSRGIGPPMAMASCELRPRQANASPDSMSVAAAAGKWRTPTPWRRLCIHLLKVQCMYSPGRGPLLAPLGDVPTSKR